MTITITKPQVIELLERAVAERGETYIDPAADYDGCSYLINDKPGCIVGLVLHYAGVDNETLTKLDKDVSGLGQYGEVDGPAELTKHNIEMDSEVFTALKEAQKLQDAQRTWGDALAAAKVKLEAGA